ncbi:MAG: DUF2442 domain-containing protein [bacterium]
MILHVNKAKYLGDYKLEVTFNDGRSGIADLSDALTGPIFENLKDISMFSQLVVDETLETVIWPNGADLAPEFIYFKAFRDDLELQDRFKQWGYIA